MMNRRVLLVPGVLGRPSEVFIYRQATGMRQYACHVAAAQYRHPETYPYPDVHLLDTDWPIGRLALRMQYAIRRCVRPTRDGVRSWRLAALAHKLDVDLIHVHFLWNAQLALEAVAQTGVPLVVTVHGTDINTALVDNPYRQAIQTVFERATRLLAVSDFIARRLEEAGCPVEKIERHYLGAPLPQIHSAPDTGLGVRVICVAAFRTVKGHRFLIDAFAKAVTENDRLQLVLVGDGPERKEIERLVHHQGLSRVVKFTGSLAPDGVQQELQHSHIYAQHSVAHRSTDATGRQWYSEEALGISFVEAAGYGLPLVATRSGGIPEICRDGYNGYLAEPQDTATFAQCILRLAKNPNLRAKLGNNGRQLVEHEFDQATQMIKLEHLYNRIVTTAL